MKGKKKGRKQGRKKGRKRKGRKEGRKRLVEEEKESEDIFLIITIIKIYLRRSFLFCWNVAFEVEL